MGFDSSGVCALMTGIWSAIEPVESGVEPESVETRLRLAGRSSSTWNWPSLNCATSFKELRRLLELATDDAAGLV